MTQINRIFALLTFTDRIFKKASFFTSGFDFFHRFNINILCYIDSINIDTSACVCAFYYTATALINRGRSINLIYLRYKYSYQLVHAKTILKQFEKNFCIYIYIYIYIHTVQVMVNKEKKLMMMMRRIGNGTDFVNLKLQIP